MKLHEYQAKELLAAYGVAVPRGLVAASGAAARAAATELGGAVAVKAQAHTGARGKAGGIKLVGDGTQAAAAAAEMLGSRLVTNQTGPAGLPVASVLVEERIAIARELYLSVVIDNAAGLPMVIASAAGGMEIEQVGGGAAAGDPPGARRPHLRAAAVPGTCARLCRRPGRRPAGAGGGADRRAGEGVRGQRRAVDRNQSAGGDRGGPPARR